MAKREMKPFRRLTPSDFDRHPVWRSVPPRERPRRRPLRHHRKGSVWWVRRGWKEPVDRLPVYYVDDCMFGTTLTLSNGRRVLGVVWRMYGHDARANQLFIRAMFWVDGKWATWIRAKRHATLFSSAALAASLGLPESEVFPIRYDIGALAIGWPDIVRGEIIPYVDDLPFASDEERVFRSSRSRFRRWLSTARLALRRWTGPRSTPSDD